MKIKIIKNYAEIHSMGYGFMYYSQYFYIEGVFKHTINHGERYRYYRQLVVPETLYPIVMNIVENWYLRKLKNFKTIPRTFMT